jgi:hypothetical protein
VNADLLAGSVRQLRGVRTMAGLQIDSRLAVDWLFPATPSHTMALGTGTDTGTDLPLNNNLDGI